MSGTGAREEVLASVRRALAGADTAPIAVPRSYRTRGRDGDLGDLANLFTDRVTDYRAVVEHCAQDEVTDRIATALAGARSLVPGGLPWPVTDAITGAVSGDHLTATELDGFDAVVTTATLGIAETGTIVLTHGPGQGRRALSLVPDLHVCLIRASDLVPDVPAAIAQLDPHHPQTWISGPSATSDIELTRVEGVHGPRRLHVIVVH